MLPPDETHSDFLTTHQPKEPDQGAKEAPWILEHIKLTDYFEEQLEEALGSSGSFECIYENFTCHHTKHLIKGAHTLKAKAKAFIQAVRIHQEIMRQKGTGRPDEWTFDMLHTMFNYNTIHAAADYSQTPTP